MANEFIIKNGFHSKGDSQITGSLSITGISNVSASIAAASGGGGSAFPFTGDAQITGSILMTGSADEGQFITFDPVSGGDVSIGTGKNATYNGLEINTAAGKYVQIGAQNASYIHFYTNANNYYFNKPVHIAGNLYSVSQDFVIGRNSGTSDTITLGDKTITLELDSTDVLIISASHVISGSSISTASFGTYIGDGSQLSGISSTPFPFTGDAQITGSLNVSSSITTFDINMSTWTLGADGGNNYYYFTGPGDLAGTEQNPDIHLTRGQKYRFYNPMDAHPFQIQDTGGSAFSTGVTNNGVQLGFLSFDVPMDGPTHLKYQCTAHAAMVGNIYIADARVASGSFSGSFQGDGSSLTGISSTPFPFTGDAQITGSLIISASATSQSLSVIGSGSTVFNIIGSEGTLFAIEDDLDGTLFTVNDRSGIPMFEVSASGRIVAEEGESIIRSQRPIVTHTSDFSITSSLDYAGKYHIVGGSITCSINTGSLVPTGAEFEFFQTSSAGNFLFITGSPHVDVIVKNDNMNLAGQGSGASLKYIGGSTFHLVGDLT